MCEVQIICPSEPCQIVRLLPALLQIADCTLGRSIINWVIWELTKLEEGRIGAGQNGRLWCDMSAI